MDTHVEEVRLLKLAEFYERAYEAFVLDLAHRHVRDPEALGELSKLTGGADHHAARVAELLERKSAEVSSMQATALERAALLDILEVERAAREFYMRNFERVDDPEVARLFRELAQEESRHVEIAEHALALADLHHGPAEGVEAAHDGYRFLDEPTPLWEGTGEPRQRGPHRRMGP